MALLATAMAVSGYVRTALSPLQESIRVSLSLTDNQLALLQGPAIGIPVTLLSIPLGLLIDRRPRIRLLLAVIAASVLSSLLTSLSSNFSALLFTRAIAGLSALAILPLVLSILPDHFEPDTRGRATMVAIIGQVGGNSAAFALGGTLLGWAGSRADAWQWATFWLIVPLVALLPIMLFLREPTRVTEATTFPPLGDIWDRLRPEWDTIVSLFAGIICAEVAIGAIIIWAAPMFSRRFLMGPEQVGGIMAVGMLISGLSGPFIGGNLADLCQRFGGPSRTISVLAAMALATIPTGLFAFMSQATLAITLLLATMTILLAIVAMGMALFTIVVPPELRGLCMSLLVAAEILFALAIAPPLVSVLSGILGGLPMIGQALSTVCVVAGLFATTSFAFGRKKIQCVEAH